jgi:hypothetical protein
MNRLQVLVRNNSSDIIYLQSQITAIGRVLTGNITIYLNNLTGSDSNDGLTPATAVYTPAVAAAIYSNLICKGYRVTIQLADGNYVSGLSLFSRIGAGDLYITGNISQPDRCTFNVPGHDCINVEGHPAGSMVYLRGVTLQTSGGGSGIRVMKGSFLQFSNVRFGQCSWHHIDVETNGQVAAVGPYKIIGGALCHILSNMGGWFFNSGSFNVDIENTPAFTNYFAWAIRNSYIKILNNEVSFTGLATGIKGRAAITSTIETGNAGASLPGNLPISYGNYGQII